MTKQILLTLALAGACGITANAELINVQFGCTGLASGSTTPGSGCNRGVASVQQTGNFAVPGVTGSDFWNMVTGDSNLGDTGTNVTLKDVRGNNVGVTVSWNGTSSVTGVGQGVLGTTGTNSSLFNSYLIENDGLNGSTITIGGLTNNKYYLLYLINQHGKGSVGDQVQYTINGNALTTTAFTSGTAGLTTPPVVQNLNWEVVTAQADGTGKINISFDNPAGSSAAVNGFQIVETPEPGTIGMALGGIAMLGIGRLRRKRQS